MLGRILKVQGIGLLHNADGRRHGLKKGTLIYAENGRGKSTLAGVLRSVSSGDPGIVASRSTIDSTASPEVELQFDSGHKVKLESGKWSERRQEILVFDAEFIERNVHSGGTVNTNHRKNLLEFALGEGAVDTQLKLDKAKTQAQETSNQVRNIERELSGHHAGISLEQFKKVKPVNNPEAALTDLRKRLDAANSATAIKRRIVPSPIPLPSLNLDSLFEILGTALEDIHEDAERVVNEHVRHIENANAENWISQGQQLEHDDNCPYCGQSLDGIELIKAYRTFFNEAYDDLKKKVAVLEAGINRRTADTIVETFAAGVSTAKAQFAIWDEQVPRDGREIDFDADQAFQLISSLRNLLLSLANQKTLRPTEAAGTNEQKEETRSLWLQLQQLMERCNEQIATAGKAINAYKQRLDSEEPERLKGEILTIQLASKRQRPEIVKLFSDLDAAKSAQRSADKSKRDEKTKLDRVMQETLSKFERTINLLLARFGASFTIHEMGTNHRGGGPRTEYGLMLRGQEIKVDGAEPSFATALSEGDRRTLAFAFFVASVLSDATLSEKTVVIDDPMCSLDLNRKQETRRVLNEIYDRADQLIVLAHDLYFLRDFRDDLAKRDAPTTALQLTYAVDQYTDFAHIDLDDECASRYYREHQLLSQFASGQVVADKRAVAKAIRPVLEGYLHRRFPGLLPKKEMFGTMIALIRDAKSSSPLAYAQSIVLELNVINSYAGLFHHNSNPDADSVDVVHGELLTYVQRALDVMYRGVVTESSAA
jgi:wobble nucleotide-excising tRNase